MSCVHEFSLRMHTLVSNHALRAWILSPNAYFGLEPCFARKQTMLAGYEDRPHLIPASGRPPCGSVSAAGRRLYIAPACGRASVPYPGVRPRKRGRPAHALLACAAGLRRHLIPCERGEPAAVPYPGVRPCKRGRPVPYAGLRRPATCCTGLFERRGILARK